MSKKIAIIGAGLASAVLADRLSPYAAITVFEKSRGTGGRMSSCRLGNNSADLGAPWFNPSHPAFSHWIRQQPEISRWHPQVRDFNSIQLTSEPLYVAAPRQSTLTRRLCNNASLITQCRVAAVVPQRRQANAIDIIDDQGQLRGGFDVALITAPAVQSVPLLTAVPSFAGIADQASTDPCWIAVITLAGMRSEADIICGEHPILYRCINDSAKPGRSAQADSETWVIEATSRWSADHIDSHADEILHCLYTEFCNVIGQTPDIIASRVHRWLLARHRSAHPSPYLWDEQTGIGAGGDWLEGNSLESSWLSANALADKLEETL